MMRYDNGYSDYLEVLDTERSLFSAELQLASARGDYQRALVNLYRALGGDWTTVPPSAARQRKPGETINDRRCNGAPQAAAAQPVATEIDVGTGAPPPNPMRKVILIALGLLLILFVYHVLSDRYTPYTSQARVEAFLTQVAPEVAGDVLEVGVKDNGAGQEGPAAVPDRPRTL